MRIDYRVALVELVLAFPVFCWSVVAKIRGKVIGTLTMFGCFPLMAV